MDLTVFDRDKMFFKTDTCPYCSKQFQSIRVKARYFRIIERYPDFGATYEGNFSPYLYEISVCPFCGFSWNNDSEEYIMPVHRERLKPMLASWDGRDLNSGPRSVDVGIHTSMRGILCDQTRKSKSSSLAKKQLHLAWIYRGLKQVDAEQRFLVAARDNYRLTLSTEDLWSEQNGSEILATYLTAVLSHYIGDEQTCVRWLSRVIFNHPEAYLRPNVVNMARSLWEDIRHADWRTSMEEIETLASEKDEPVAP